MTKIMLSIVKMKQYILFFISDGAKIHQRCDVRSNFTIFGFNAIRFRLTDAMHPIQRALESPDLQEHFQ